MSAREPDREANQVSALFQRRTVVVEDEGVTVLQLKHILRKHQALVVGLAHTARDAVKVVLSERPDLVILDINMPGDMDGLDAAAEIMATYRPCIVVMSAYDMPEFLERAASVGTCGYVRKPVTEEALVPQLATALAIWSSAPES